VHQAFYPFYLLLAIWCLAHRRLSVVQFGASGIPLILYYVTMAIAQRNPNWVLEYHGRSHLKASGALPAFDAIIGTLLRGNAVGLLKGTFVFLVFISAALLRGTSLRSVTG